MTARDSAWITEAICASSDPDAFTAEVITPTMATILKRICAECPVTAECFKYAVDNNLIYGVWGGTTPTERRRIKARRSA